MANLCTRHPRYSLFTAFALLATFLLLASNHSPPSSLVDFSGLSSSTPGALERKVQIAEKIYQKTLAQRQGLIRKHGPTPDKIHMFPPNVEPWPPYTVWDFFPAAFNCPHEIERIGALGDGGKWVCGLSRVANKPDCIIYSFGINHESSFEAELLQRTSGCQIWGYDFSVSQFGPEIDFALSSRTHFHAFGLSGHDAHTPTDDPPMYTLKSLMAMNNHQHVDILKIDIEGWEFETLTALVKDWADRGEPLPFGQLQLEIHAWDKKFSQYLKWWETLEEAGLRPFWTEPNEVYMNYNRGGSPDLAEYSFLNIKGRNVFISSTRSPEEDERVKRVRHGPRD